jgi:hypothetical protein
MLLFVYLPPAQPISVILSEARNLSSIEPRRGILRFAQNDKSACLALIRANVESKPDRLKACPTKNHHVEIPA